MKFYTKNGIIMHKIFFVLLLIAFSSSNLTAKYVKFAVDMTGQTVSSSGVHVSGDFQNAAGYSGGDWVAGSTEMKNETGTNIYSVVVNIPAFAKYEFAFINSDQWYNMENIPTESIAGKDYSGYRWIWVDSLSNDTTYAGAVLFSGNAPTGKKLLRFFVDMQSVTAINSNSVHVFGDFQGLDPAKTMLYSFSDNIYQIIAYVDSATTYKYKFINGNTLSDAEIVPDECATDGYRTITITDDTLLAKIVTDDNGLSDTTFNCYASCGACVTNAVEEYLSSGAIKIYPNPIYDYTLIEFSDNCLTAHDIIMFDETGNKARTYDNYQGDILRIDKENLNPGVYFVKILNKNNQRFNSYKIVILDN